MTDTINFLKFYIFTIIGHIAVVNTYYRQTLNWDLSDSKIHAFSIVPTLKEYTTPIIKISIQMTFGQ